MPAIAFDRERDEYMSGGSFVPSSSWLSASVTGQSPPAIASVLRSSRTSGPTTTRAPRALRASKRR